MVMDLLVYVDDIIIKGSENAKIEKFIALLGQWFSLKDLDNISCFLGVEATCSSQGMLITQCKYINDLLAKINMSSANPVFTSMVANTPLLLMMGTTLT